MKKSTEIRQDFLDFFASKGHKIVPSAAVFPYDDPTLLFTNAGMNQFKDVFLGTGTRDYKRCADTQKCIRVSGKHNDLEEVGHDGYHHTFFEMLGNWSFGDYYKKEAIEWAWEILTKVWGLDKKRLWVTYYREDLETKELWETHTDIDHSHILKFDEKDNFWEMGDTGPCGPCSEIHYDFTPNGCKGSDVNADNPDVMEIWNLVFIQYNRDNSGKLHDLPQKHVDTGMGFERMVRVLQNKSSNYLTDVFLPLINELINITGKDYSGKYEAPMNVIADHVRTLTFAIGDGATPSKEKRGYVLRSILRRASFYGTKLDMHTPFIYKLVDVLVETMGHVFPEIVEKKDFIKKVIHLEEESFNETLDKGLLIFESEVERLKQRIMSENAIPRLTGKSIEVKEHIFSGEAAFKLHDTFGFPIGLTQLMAKESGYEVDVNKFDELMNEQKDRARSNREESNKIIETSIKDFNAKSGYYNPYIIDNRGIEIFILNHTLLENSQNELVIVDKNPFYIESGGQVSDTGKLVLENKHELSVEKPFNGSYLYIKGPTNLNLVSKSATAFIDFPRRQAIQRNHTATHLVHEALRRVLGSEIRQMGSYLDEKLLRFDFPHFHKLTDAEIKKIEDIVNKKIEEDIQVITEELPIDEAKQQYPNLRMFFGDKYGKNVRVVIIDESFSVELCGGTHVKNTKEIGFFKIIKEESIATGTRRITAVTWDGQVKNLINEIDKNESVLEVIKDKITKVNQIDRDSSEKFKEKVNELTQDLSKIRTNLGTITLGDSMVLSSLTLATFITSTAINFEAEKIEQEKKQLEKELAKQKVQSAAGSIDELIKSAIDVSGIKLIIGKFDVSSTDELKDIGDKLREKMGSGVGLLYAVIDDKVGLCAVVSDDLVKDKKLSAGKIAGDTAKILGGGGGGKPHLATAGGKDVSKINDALEALPGIIKKYL